jgi:hypothetical protein
VVPMEDVGSFANAYYNLRGECNGTVACCPWLSPTRLFSPEKSLRDALTGLGGPGTLFLSCVMYEVG